MLIWHPAEMNFGGGAQTKANFVLSSSRGGKVDSRNLLGTPFMVHFGYTHCTEVCPTMLNDVGNMLHKLGPAAKDMRVFFITVDPDRDTVETVRDFLANFDPHIEGLVPTPGELQQLASEFRVFYTKVPSASSAYSMDHTASMFLFDANGRLFDTIAFGEPPEMVEEKMLKLFSGGQR
ncbi:MAG: SCO family protein [Aestuariivirga sp.]|uniref:SCO family protein n=1 Tax=Aestuariivirga sp. TaxID=2650926 RepID=UPI0038D10B16